MLQAPGFVECEGIHTVAEATQGLALYHLVCVAQHDELAWIGGQGTEP
jgi:hypothetical protein